MPFTAMINSVRQEVPLYLEHFHLLHFALLNGIPVLLWFGFSMVELKLRTAVLFLILYEIHSIAITAGYHRLWSHRSYRASLALRYILASIGAGSFQWSILWWVQHHRAHHRYLDTDKDPYNARRGLFYTHVGWLIAHNPAGWGKVDISDLKRDSVVIWQKRYYLPIAVTTGVLIPTIIAHVGWNDWQGGFLYAGVLRIFVSAHATFLVNSLAHYAGSQPYSTTYTPRDNVFVAFLTSGEGYHNFHHQFPADYRNGISWCAFDPSKWLIWSCVWVGLASNPFRTPQREIQSVYRKEN